MGQPTLFETIRQNIATIAYRVYLWAINMTDEEYQIAKYDEAIACGDPRHKAIIDELRSWK